MYRRFAILVSFLFVTIEVLVSQPKLLWTTTKTNPDSTIQLSDAARDYSGNIYTVTFGGNKYGITLNKYSNVGTLIRETPLSNQITYKYWLAADKGGNAYVVTNDDQKKLTLTKYSPTGDSLWAKKFILPLPQEDYREGNTLINIDGNGNVYLATEHEQRIGNGYFRMYVMMLSYSPNGERRWIDTTISSLVTTREPEYGDLMLGKLTVDQSDNIIVSLTSRAMINPLLYIGETKIIKYASNGSGGSNPPQWIQTYSENPVNVEFNDMDVDNGGNIFVGYSGGKVRKYNSQGAFQWQRTVSGGMKLAADNNGGVYVGDGKFESFLKTIGRVFHFTDSESTYVGPFGSGNYNAITHIAVDQGGYVGVSGYVKSTFSAAEGIFNFYEYTPSGSLSGAVAYASPGVSYEIPLFLFKGNGSYTVAGQSAYPKSKSVLWIGKVQVAPVLPPDPDRDRDRVADLKPIEIASGTTADLHGVWFNTATSGYIVGDSSIILHSADAGRSWSKMLSPVVADFKKVRFMNADTGFIVGTGCILRTSNGGGTWLKVDDVAPQTIHGITWNSSGRVVAVGSSGIIRLSTDNGVTWQLRTSPTISTLRDVAENYYSSNFQAGGEGGLLIKSDDGGSNWDILRPPGLPGENIRSIYNIDGYPRHFYSVGNILMEDDKILLPPPFQINATNRHRTVLPMVGVGSGGNIISFTYGFASYPYTVQNIGQHDLFDVFRDGLFAIVVGAGGKIHQLLDGHLIPLPKRTTINSFTMLSKDEILFSDDLDIWKTIDGGVHWYKPNGIEMPYPILYRSVKNEIIFASPRHITDYTIYQKYQRSTDRGETWTLHDSPDSLSVVKIMAPDTKAVWMRTSSQYSRKHIFRSTDNGSSWNRCQTDSMSLDKSVAVDSVTAWATEIRNDTLHLKKTTDGGVNWNTKYTVFFPNASTQLLVLDYNTVIMQYSHASQITIRTTDGGGSWQQVLVPGFMEHLYEGSSSLRSQLNYWPVEGGVISRNIVTNDGGISWQKLPLPAFGKLLPNYDDGEDRSLQVGDYVRHGYGDSTFYVSSDTRSIFIHDPQPLIRMVAKTSREFHHRRLTSGAFSSTINRDTIFVSTLGPGIAARDVSVGIDSIIAVLGKTMLMIEHAGIIDTSYCRHGAPEATNVITDSYFSDLSPFLLTQRHGSIKSSTIAPLSPLSKFNGTPAEGKWIITVVSDAPHTSRLTGWSLYMGTEISTGVDKTIQVPGSFSLSQNYPNPFNPTTMINYQLPMNSKVSLKIYDILGREVATLVNEVVNAGTYSTPFNSTRLASGVYFYRIEATSTDGSHNRFVDVKKMMYLK